MLYKHKTFAVDVVVGFESTLYQVDESSGLVQVKLIIQGETSNHVSVTLQTIDQEAVGRKTLFP